MIAPLPLRRDPALDIVRGLALITITINHFTGLTVYAGMRGAAFPTLSHYGFSGAAEIFFLLSGYLVGAAYLKADSPAPVAAFARRAWRRAGQLYLANLLLFAVLLPLCLASPFLARLSYFHYFIGGGIGAFGQFLGLYVQPYCLEILVTYAVLLAAAPLFVALLLVRPGLALLTSVALYIAAYKLPGLKLPGGMPGGDWKWNFSPASWQFLFYAALAAGRWRLLERLRRRMAEDGRWLALAAVLLAGLTALFLAQDLIGFEAWGQSKVRIGPLRIVHALAVAATLLGVLWRWPALASGAAGRAIALIGANSLESFVACVALSYAAGFLWVELAPTHLAYLLLCPAMVAALALIARRDSWRIVPIRSRPVMPAEASIS